MKHFSSLSTGHVGRVVLLAAIAGVWLSSPAGLLADTVFLKDGNQILDCQVTRETDTMVYVRTPLGDMGVPRSQIHRILRSKTAYDRYREQLATVRPDDTNGLLKLALWCRKTPGLRKEADAHLETIIELKPNHTRARKLLGHVLVRNEWVVPDPLSISLRISGANGPVLLERLQLFLSDRKDVRVLPELAKGSRGSSNDLDECLLNVSVIVSRKAATKFYGQSVGRGSLGASIRLESQDKWVGKKLKTAAEGSVPANAGNAALAMRNAFGQSERTLHMFFDQLVEIRAKKLAAQPGKVKPDPESER